MTTFGFNVKIARGRKGWSQVELADRIGVSVKTISEIECGRVTNPSAPVLAGLADQLEVDAAELLNTAPPVPPARDNADRGSNDSVNHNLHTQASHLDSEARDQANPSQKLEPPASGKQRERA
jgi:transcriptional regulator with XRE-family HTH domain